MNVMKYGALTDVGICRRINEDNYFIHPNGDFPYAVVADGMGGHQAGEVASMMVVDILENHLSRNFSNSLDYVEAGEVVRQAFIAANSIIYNYSKNHYKVMGMGTTTTLALVYQNKLITAHVGDSRAYLLTNQNIEQVTNDHSYVSELLRRGEISPEMARTHPKKNYITRAMGAEDTVKVDIGIRDYHGEKILLCTDGLVNFVEDETILECINAAETLQSGADCLVSLANERGGKDNITVVVLEKENSDDE